MKNSCSSIVKQLIVLCCVMVLSSSFYFSKSCLKYPILANYKQAMFMSKKLDIRPSVDDVERISKGQAAKRRGTGSRAVPHRLNVAERREWDLAKRRRFLLLRGTGWRRERGDSPLANIYRNYCDAVAVPCITVLRSVGIGVNNDLADTVIVDFSPLRTVDVGYLVEECKALCKDFSSVNKINDDSDLSLQDWGSAAEVDAILRQEVIWRLPVYSFSVSFTIRSEAKKFAETLAVKFAGGISGEMSYEAEVLAEQQEEEALKVLIENEEAKNSPL